VSAKGLREKSTRLQPLESRSRERLLARRHGYPTVDLGTPRTDELEAASLKITEEKPQTAVA